MPNNTLLSWPRPTIQGFHKINNGAVSNVPHCRRTIGHKLHHPELILVELELRPSLRRYSIESGGECVNSIVGMAI